MARAAIAHEATVTRAASINATTSASSNSTTRALTLYRVILPASAHRKIVREQIPGWLAMDFALLNLRMAGAADAAGDSVFVSLHAFLRFVPHVGNGVSPLKLR